MEGTSRTALELLQAELPPVSTSGTDSGTLFAGEPSTLSRDLLAVSSLLGRDGHLRSTVSSTGIPPEAKTALVQALFGERIGTEAMPVVLAAAHARWSRSRDLVDALEILGVEAAFQQADAAGTLGQVEEELFRVARAIEGSQPLRTALSDPAVPSDARTALVRDLIGSRADALTTSLVEHIVVSPRGRRVETVLEEFVEIAASRHSEVLAEVSAAIELSAEQESRLTAALSRIYSSKVRLQVSVDPTLQGGIVVRVGDEVIDGSVIHRLESARTSIVR